MARATIESTAKRGDRIVIYTQYSEKDLVRQVPGVNWDADLLAWTLPVSWAAVNQLRGVFGANLESSQALADWAWHEYETRVKLALELRDQLSAAGDHVTWRPYQLADVNFMLAAGDCCVANEPGTGKTVSSLTAARAIHYARAEALPMLIICPNSVKRHWASHFDKWFPEAHPYVITGGAVGRVKALREAREDPLAAVIINIEAVRLHSKVGAYGAIRLARCEECFRRQDHIDAEAGVISPVPTSRCDVHEKELNEFDFQTVILDEAHRTKDPTTKQTRACWNVMWAPAVKQRWGLTGTPIANHIGDLWSIMHGIAREEYPAKSEFIDRYALFTWNDHGTMDISDARPDTKDELFKFLDPRMRRMLQRIVNPQLPPKVWTTYEAEMTAKQRKMYAEMHDQLFARDEQGTMLVATNNLVKNTRLIQLASSCCEVEYTPADPDDPESKDVWKVNLVNPSSKVDVLLEILDDFEGKQVVVSAFSRKLIELAAKRLTDKGVDCVQITGGVREWERDENLRRFQSGNARVMLFTLGAGGTGIDMTAASVMVRLQRSYSMLENVQGVGRIERIGAEHHTALHIIDVIAPGTVEDDQLERIREKEQRLETIVRDREALTRAGHDTSHLELEYAAIVGSTLLGEE